MNQPGNKPVNQLAQLVQQITAKLAAGERNAAEVLLQAAPQHPLFAVLRGMHAHQCGNFTQALDYYDQAAAAGIPLPELPIHKTQALLALGRLDDAEATLNQMADSIPALLLREEIAAGRKDFAASLDLSKRIIAAGHRTPHSVTNLLASAAKLCDWSVDIGQFSTGELTPAVLVFYNDDNAQMNAVARAVAGQRPASPRPARAPRAGRRLKIGYLGDDFRHHATSHLIAQLFALHDRNAFECFVFSYGRNDGSNVAQRIAQTAEHFVDLAGRPGADIYAALHDAELDILIDMKGHALNNMLPWLAARVAPLQLHWLGFPGPTAMPFIDYNVGDAIITPAGFDFADAVLTLPGCSYQLNDRQRTAATPLTRTQYGLPEDAIVLGSFNQTSKIRPDWFLFMCDLLRDNPRAVLWQYCDIPQAEANLRRVLDEQGIAQDRMVITPAMPHDQHLARMAVADLMPDTIPCGGHTTTSEALWMGLPVATLYGHTFASRVSASLLHSAGFDELVTRRFDDYKTLVRDLVANPDRLAELRLRIAAARDTCALFDSPRWVKTWESVLTDAYDKVVAQ